MEPFEGAGMKWQCPACGDNYVDDGGDNSVNACCHLIGKYVVAYNHIAGKIEVGIEKDDNERFIHTLATMPFTRVIDSEEEIEKLLVIV